MPAIPEGLTVLEAVAILSAGGAGALLGWVLLDNLRRARERRLAATGEIIVTETQSPVIRALLPAARRIGGGMRAMLDTTPEDESAPPGFYRVMHRRIAGRLASAGSPEGINADEYIGFSILCALAGGMGGLLLFILAKPTGLFTLFFGGLVLGGMRMPAWLSRKMRERHNRILKELPFALDLLTLAMEAGLDFTSALDRICRKLGDSPLGSEFQFMMREIRFGKSRSDAMRDLARRVAMTEVQSVVSSLVQAEEMGSNIGPVLRLQADQQRERRSQRAEETAGKMPVKLLFPLVLLMLVTMEVIFAPMIIAFVQ